MALLHALLLAVGHQMVGPVHKHSLNSNSNHPASFLMFTVQAVLRWLA